MATAKNLCRLFLKFCYKCKFAIDQIQKNSDLVVGKVDSVLQEVIHYLTLGGKFSPVVHPELRREEWKWERRTHVRWIILSKLMVQKEEKKHLIIMNMKTTLTVQEYVSNSFLIRG